MKPCQHASYCPRRMRDGDRPGGCDAADGRACVPELDRKLPVPYFPTISFQKTVDAGQNKVA